MLQELAGENFESVGASLVEVELHLHKYVVAGQQIVALGAIQSYAPV